MSDSTNVEKPVCPDCGQVPHNPQTGFCWLSKSRNPRSGFHCDHCCDVVLTQRVIDDARRTIAEEFEKQSDEGSSQ